MAKSKVWLITGASSGFGRTLTEYLLKQGHRVVATLRRPEVLSDLVRQYPSTQLTVVKLDVTQHAEVSAAFAKAHEAFGRVDVVFNNAGGMINGELESVEDKDVRPMFEVNFWGAADVSREAVRFFREVNKPQGGRLLQVTSSLAIKSIACYGHYSASKFAIEGLTEALANELDPAWGIKITMLQMGPFYTEIAAGNRTIFPPHPAYASPQLAGSKWRDAYKAGGFMDGDPQKACVAFEKVSQLDDPPLRLPLHRMAIGRAKAKAKELMENAEEYEAWSEDLYL